MSDTGMEGCRQGGKQLRREEGKKGCRKGGMQYRWDSGQMRCRLRGIQDRRDHRKGWMQESSDAMQEWRDAGK